MNYARIYEEFISDRRAKEPELSGYSEKHHIVPQSRGGGNEASNLIRLTAEDHFFAHLLLAKMYGGGMWTAVRLMRWGKVGGERPGVQGRYMYAVARNKHALYISASQKGRPGVSGPENGNFDPLLREWTNLDTGRTQTATTTEMWLQHGGSRQHWASAATGKRAAMLGWSLHPSANIRRSFKGRAFRFVNGDGRNFTGTQSAFCSATGLSKATACRVVRLSLATSCGWKLAA